MSTQFNFHRHSSSDISKTQSKVRVTDLLSRINEEKKSEMTKKSIMFEEENHSFDKIKLSDFVIKSPGISNSSEIISKIKSSGIPIVSEIETFPQKTNLPVMEALYRQNFDSG